MPGMPDEGTRQEALVIRLISPINAPHNECQADHEDSIRVQTTRGGISGARPIGASGGAARSASGDGQNLGQSGHGSGKAGPQPSRTRHDEKQG